MIMAARIFIPFLVLCGTWRAYAVVNCGETGAGRFADPDDNTCKNYTLCIYVQNEDISYIAYDAVCPSVSVFNPKTSICTSPTEYNCSNRTTDTSRNLSQICNHDGYIADPVPNNCSTYIQCVNISGEFTQLRRSCPGTTYFNPKTTLCEPNYKCVNFTCSSPGRIADAMDFTCRKYYYCVHLYNDSYAQFDYSCPTDSMFHPETKLCTENYECN